MEWLPWLAPEKASAMCIICNSCLSCLQTQQADQNSLFVGMLVTSFEFGDIFTIWGKPVSVEVRLKSG